MLLALREQAARWLRDKGIEQWTPGEVSLDEVRQQVDAREWFVLRQADTIVASLRLLSTDEPVWGPQPAEAAGLRRLLVTRSLIGQGPALAMACRQGTLSAVEIADSARRHGVTDEDIQAAVSVPLRLVLQGEGRMLVIGADSTGRLLEVVVLDPHNEPFAIHAMPLRTKFYRYL